MAVILTTSLRPITLARVESWKAMILWRNNDGIILRTAWGQMTKRVTCHGFNPVDRPARRWSARMDCNPVRINSAKYAASKAVKAMSAA